MPQRTPSTDGDNGRQSNGRFAAGNKLGRGNPFNHRACKLRAAMLAVVTADDIQGIVATLIKAAKEGDVVAAKEIFNRVLGTPIASDAMGQLEQWEAIYERQQTA